MNDYQDWNEKLSKKMNYYHKLYTRFMKRYTAEPVNDMESPYSIDVTKHLINYDESNPKTRFIHVDMAAMDAETLAIVKLFEDMKQKKGYSGMYHSIDKIHLNSLDKFSL